jgi:hypothetical protein
MIRTIWFGLVASFVAVTATSTPIAAQQQQKRPNVVMLMTDDTGWNDFGAYTGGGAALGHPTPNIDRIAKEAPGNTGRNPFVARATFSTLRLTISIQEIT